MEVSHATSINFWFLQKSIFLVKCSSGQYGFPPQFIKYWSIKPLILNCYFSFIVWYQLHLPFWKCPKEADQLLSPLAASEQQSQIQLRHHAINAFWISNCHLHWKHMKEVSACGYQACISTLQGNKAFIMSNTRQIKFGNVWQKKKIIISSLIWRLD